MKKYKMLFVFFTAVCSFASYFLLPASAFAQVDTAWVRRYNGPGNGNDYAYAIAVDASGNVYMTGGGSSGINRDYATIKYNSSGVEQWVMRYNGTANGDDQAYAMVVDNAGNVYVTGYCNNSGTNYDYVTIKYTSNGVQQWLSVYNDTLNLSDIAHAIALDSTGNVYLTGESNGSGTNTDYATIKYNTNGSQQWVKRYNGPGNSEDYASAIAVDGSGNVYVTGSSTGSGTGRDFTTIKYSSGGDSLWVKRYTGAGNNNDMAYAIALDGLGNVYVTGYSYNSATSADYTTIKYNSSGVQEWVKIYNGPGNDYDAASGIAVDGSGNIYVTGYSIVSGTNYDYATIKYNSNGDTLWARRYNGPLNQYDWARAIAVDGSGNVYVTGESFGTWLDYATIKYNSAGVQEWVQRYNGPGNYYDYATAIAVDGAENVYVTGRSNGLGNYDYVTIKYVQTQGVEENHQPLSADRLSLEVYPNPAKTFFTLRLPLSADRIKIYDVSGKLIKEVRSKRQEARISTEGIKNGIYFVKVGAEVIKEKLVIAK